MLQKGNFVVVGPHFGKIRMLLADGKQQKQITPGYCGDVVGLPEAASVGELLQVVRDEKSAKQVAAYRLTQVKQEGLSVRQISMRGDVLSETLEKTNLANPKKLQIVLKVDVGWIH